MKPICVKCQRFYRMKKAGYAFIEGMPINNGVQPGTAEPAGWKPYKLWAGDLWECKGCGHQLISGTGSHPIAEHYQPGFKDKVLKLVGEQFQVNDC